jgi:hypothetical protein
MITQHISEKISPNIWHATITKINNNAENFQVEKIANSP